MKKFLAGASAIAATLFAVTTASAAYSLFGNAEIVSPGNGSDHAVEASSDSSATDPFGGIEFTVPEDTTVDDLSTLATDYMLVEGDCGGGSPRFSVSVDTTGDGTAEGNLFVYIGPEPDYTGCPADWQSTGNLLEGTRVDATQFGGAFYGTLAEAQALIGDGEIVSISLVVDGSWTIDPQTFDFDNVDINGEVYTFEPAVPAAKDDCKNGGWQEMSRDDFSTFKNQGDCIQYFNTGR